MLVVSDQLLRQQTGPELDRLLIQRDFAPTAELSRSVRGIRHRPARNRPLGLIGVPGVAQNVAIDPTDLHGSFCAVEEHIETAHVDMSNYGVIVWPGTRKITKSNHSDSALRCRC